MKFRRITTRLALQKSASRPSPNRIPLSGDERLDGRNYFSSYLADAGGLSYLVAGRHAGGVEILQFDGAYYSIPRSFTWNEAADLRLEIVQYFKREELRFRSPLAFLLSYALQVHRWRHLMDRTAQGLYNRGRLARADRLQLLRLLVERALDPGHEQISALMLLRVVNTRRLVRHPDLNRSLAHLRLHLRSLVATEDASEHEGGYRATPQGLTTLSRYEDEERRHADMRKLQGGAVIFAAVTAMGVLFKPDQIQQFLLNWTECVSTWLSGVVRALTV